MEENFYIDYPADNPELLDASDNVEGAKVKELERKNRELQDKIYFAIAELKKVIDFMESEDSNYYPAPFEIKNFIRKQIEKLKEKTHE